MSTPLTRIINSLPLATVLPDQTCAICLETAEKTEGRSFTSHKNQHFFHRDCLVTWINQNHTTCPICRESLNPEAISEVALEIIEQEEDENAPLLQNLANYDVQPIAIQNVQPRSSNCELCGAVVFWIVVCYFMATYIVEARANRGH